MRHQQALEAPRRRQPAARVGRAAGPVQVDRAAARPMPMRAGRLLRLGRAERELRGLHQLVHEAVDGPGVDELVRTLGPVGRLGVAFGYLDERDAERLRERRPAGLIRGRLGVLPKAHREVEQRLFHEVRDETGIRAVIDDGRRCAGLQPPAELQHVFARAVVGALAHREHRVVEDAWPGLDRRVDIKHAVRGAPLDEVEARDIHRQVEQQVARLQAPPQLALVGGWLEVAVDEPCVIRRGKRATLFAGLEHGEPVLGQRQVPAQQRQHGLADAAAADHQHAAGKLGRFDALSPHTVTLAK